MVESFFDSLLWQDLWSMAQDIDRGLTPHIINKWFGIPIKQPHLTTNVDFLASPKSFGMCPYPRNDCPIVVMYEDTNKPLLDYGKATKQLILVPT